jgi:predicted adenine nucleotide alpha hydrolase (AANH) superfamily ATPase
MDNLTKIFWKNEAVRLNKELDKEKVKLDKFVEDFNQCLIAKDHTQTGKWLKKHFDRVINELFSKQEEKE